MDIEVKNAVIKSVFVGIEDHGIMTCMVHLEYDHAGQGFGGYSLDTYDKQRERRIGTAYGMEWLMMLLRTVEVDSIDKLVGRPVRVKAENHKIHALGHYLKDQWFDPKRDLEFLAIK